MEFQELKSEVIRRATEAGACDPSLEALHQCKSIEALVEVLKKNWGWVTSHNAIDGPLLEAVGNDVLNPLGVFVNCDATGDGCLLLTGNSRAVCRDNSRAVCRDNSRAECWDNSRAVCWDNSYCVAKNEIIKVKLSDNAVARFEQTNRIVVTNNPKIEIYETESN